MKKRIMALLTSLALMTGMTSFNLLSVQASGVGSDYQTGITREQIYDVLKRAYEKIIGSELIHTCSITVLDKDSNEPVAGAVVSCSGKESVTDKSGDCDISLPGGNYDATVSCDGYKNAVEQIKIEDNPLGYFGNDFTKMETIYLEKDTTALQYSKYIGEWIDEAD